MRIKLIALATVVAALAIGVTASQASLQQTISATVKFKKAGGPGSVSLNYTNLEPSGGNPDALVPERISQFIIKSKSVKYNSKALPYCNITIPTNAAGNNNSDFLVPEPGQSNSSAVLKACPIKSLVGKGTFEAVVGTVGQPFDPSQSGLITGKLYVYNFKPRSGDQAAMVAWIQSDNPVPNANQYQYVGVSKSGTITTIVPSRDDIPPKIAAVLPAGTISMTKIKLTLTSPKPSKKKGKPLFTIKSFSNLDIYGQIVRD